MEGASRTRLVALAVLLAVSVPLVVIAVAGGGSDDAAGLRIEPSPPDSPGVVIYLEDPEVNELDTNRGRPAVTIECTDGNGGVVYSGRERWPFSDTDGGTLDPHVHVFMDAAQAQQIARCRLKGTEPALEGRKA